MSSFNLFTNNLRYPSANQLIPYIALLATIQIGEVLISSYKAQMLLLLSQS